jgi:hypothetical protein
VGQEALLDELRHVQLAVDSLALADLLLPPAHQLGQPQGGRRLAGQVAEQRAIVGRVAPLAAPRAQVEQPDQLPLADQRHHQLGAGRAELAQGGGVEPQRPEVDRSAEPLDVRRERVAGRDLEPGRLGVRAERLQPQ